MKGMIKLALLCVAFVLASGCGNLPKPIGADDQPINFHFRGGLRQFESELTHISRQDIMYNR